MQEVSHRNYHPRKISQLPSQSISLLKILRKENTIKDTINNKIFPSLQT